MGSLKESVEQQSSALTATLEPLKEATRGIGTELDSLKRPVSLLAGSIGEVRQQIDAAKQDFSSAQLKTTIAAAGDAAVKACVGIFAPSPTLYHRRLWMLTFRRLKNSPTRSPI